jgi:hypothetical protein
MISQSQHLDNQNNVQASTEKEANQEELLTQVLK